MLLLSFSFIETWMNYFIWLGVHKHIRASNSHRHIIGNSISKVSICWIIALNNGNIFTRLDNEYCIQMWRYVICIYNINMLSSISFWHDITKFPKCRGKIISHFRIFIILPGILHIVSSLQFGVYCLQFKVFIKGFSFAKLFIVTWLSIFMLEPSFSNSCVYLKTTTN